jgi:hypothetical protein
MVLWVDKYRPVTLGKLSFHDDITARLTSMVRSILGSSIVNANHVYLSAALTSLSLFFSLLLV